MNNRQYDKPLSPFAGQDRGGAMAAGLIGRFLFFLFPLIALAFILNLLEFTGVLGRDWEIVDFAVNAVCLILLVVVFVKYRRGKAAEVEFVRGRDFMEAVLDHAPPLCITGLDFSILCVNRAYCDIFHPGGESLPGHCYDSRPGDQCRSSSCPLEMIRSGRDEAVCEAVKTMPAGERVFMISARPFLNREGELAGVVEVFTDVTRLKQLEEEARTHRYLEGLATLAGGMAHDFNNLLTVVFGNQEMAAAISREPGVKDILAESATALSQARELSTRLLMMADSGIDSHREVGDLVPLAEESFRRGLDDHGVKAIFDSGAYLPRMSFAPAQMEQAFSSLAVSCLERMNIGDAILFRSRGVELDDDNDLGLTPGLWLSIWITEQGDGLAPETAARIFEPYYSLRPLDNTKGRGLGMSLAYAVITRHGGRMLLSSATGAGTTLRVMLPAAGPVPSRESGAGLFHPAAPGMEVLGEVFILDDDETVAGIIADMLAHLGYASWSFSRGEDLIEIFSGLSSRRRPLIVLLDLVVSVGLGGLVTLRRLQEIAPETRTMAVSGQTHDEIMKYPREFGFSAALKKPFDFEDLKKALDAAIGPHIMRYSRS